MERNEMIMLARKTAAEYELAPALVCAVAEQESSWLPWSIRYEHGFFQRYISPMIIDGQLKNETEARARSFSWGLMQVMGEVAREHGFTLQLSQLCDPFHGLSVGCQVLAAKLKHAKGVTEEGLLLWNGGGNKAYPAEVMARMAVYL